MIQLHQTEYERDVLIPACREAIATGSNEDSIVERFINHSQVDTYSNLHVTEIHSL